MEFTFWLGAPISSRQQRRAFGKVVGHRRWLNLEKGRTGGQCRVEARRGRGDRGDGADRTPAKADNVSPYDQVASQVLLFPAAIGQVRQRDYYCER